MAEPHDDDAYWMRRALALASPSRPSPNPRVGSVVVREGDLVGEGFHAGPGREHAEVAALEAAGERARGATVYVTLEPCNHHGRTPPCTDALLAAGVSRVVVGVRDPNPRVAGHGVERLRAAGVEVAEGIEGDACAALVRSWRKFVTTDLPYVVLKVGMSLDGRIATRTGESKWITGEAARRDAHALRARADAVLVGSGTVLADDPGLTPRGVPLPPGPLPARVVLDTNARTPPDSQLVRTALEAPAWVVHADDADPARVTALRAHGADTIALPRREGGRVAITDVLCALASRGVVELLVEGGGTVHGAFLDARAADALVCYIAPTLLGGERSRAAFGGEGVASLADAYALGPLVVERVGNDLKVSAEFAHVHGNHHGGR